jgi:hypothetical protein
MVLTMKIFIWIACFFSEILVTLIIKYTTGITLGGIPSGLLFAATFLLAVFLCKKWDLHKVDHNGSKKPLIVGTYVLLSAIIVTLSVFCVLPTKDIKEKENTISQLENDIAALREELMAAENKITQKDNDLKTVKASLQNKEADLSYVRNELASANSEIAYWKKKAESSGSGGTTSSYEFSSVNALLKAIKNNPTAYSNKQVCVYGMIIAYTWNDEKNIALIDYKGEDISFPDGNYGGYKALRLVDDKIEAKEAIDAIFSNDLQYTVAETGDYVNLYGTVRVANGEIYLDECQYD